MRSRQSFRSAVLGQLGRGHLGWCLQAGQRALRLRLGLPIHAPLFATLAVTYRCNYRCSFCDFPDRADGEPTTEQLLERVELLARQGALALGLTGGEPTLHPGLFNVVERARDLGLLVHLNSNGSRWEDERCELAVRSGLHSINFSVDGATAQTHDQLRRVPGSFADIERSVARLLDRSSRPRVSLIMAITPTNRGEVEEFADVAERWGVDGFGFLPHHTFVEQRDALDPATTEELARSLERLLARSDNSPGYLRGIPRFLGGHATSSVCSAAQSHVAVDPDGVSYPCVPLMTLTRSGVPLEQLDRAHFGPNERDRAEVCRQCWWNCHREVDLSIGRLRDGFGSSPHSPSSRTCSA